MQKRLVDLDVMKGLTILLVVFAHVTRMYTPKGVVQIGYSASLEALTNFIYLFHMPAFVMITGAVYFFVKRELGKYKDQKGYIQNKFVRLIVPFLFFSLFVVLPTLLYVGLIDSILMFLVKQVLLMASNTHLWYSVMIFNVFILFNFFEKKIYETDDRKVWGLFTLLHVLSFVIPNAFQAANTLNYAVFFYAGYWFQKDKETNVERLKKWKWGALALTLAAYGALFHVSLPEWYLLNKLIQFVGAIGGSALLYLFCQGKSSAKWMEQKWFETISEKSYGIYLFHPMIIYVLSFWVRSLELQANPYLVTIAMFVLSTVLSLLFSKLLEMMNLQVVIGERTRSQEKIVRT